MKRLDQTRAASFFWAAILDVILIGTLIIVHEQNSALKVFLNRLTGHHWLTKSAMTVVLFPGLAALLYGALGRSRSRIPRANRLTFWAAVLTAVTGLFVAATIVFFVVEYFK